MVKRPDSRLVYTSDPEEARRQREATEAKPASDKPPEQQKIRVAIDRKRRAGKTVTVASGFELTAQTLGALAGELKRRCGAGGTSTGREIEIQGDHVDLVAAELARRGYRVKR